MNPVEKILDHEGPTQLQDIEIGLRRGGTTVWVNYLDVMLLGCRVLGETKMTKSVARVTGIMSQVAEIAEEVTAEHGAEA